MPAHRFPSSDWSLPKILLTRVADVLNSPRKCIPLKTKLGEQALAL